MARLELGYFNLTGATWLKCLGNLDLSWGSWKHGQGFFGLGREDFRGDRKAEIFTQLVARPNHLAWQVENFPDDFRASGEFELGAYAISGGGIAMVVAVQAIESELSPSEGFQFGTAPILLSWRSPIGFELAIRFKLQPPPGRGPRVMREWNTQFFQGGLPSLGKRRP